MSIIDQYGNDMDTWRDACAAAADHQAFLEDQADPDDPDGCPEPGCTCDGEEDHT